MLNSRGYSESIHQDPHPNDQIFILTEAHQGIQIFEWILHNAGKNQMTENKAALIMREIFSALIMAKEKGLVHRDLRSENILIS
jgi:serine/threonine protein kinase